MSQNVNGLRLEELEIKPHAAGIESIFDLAISIPHQLIEDGGILAGPDIHIALDIVMKAKKALIDSGLLAKDFSQPRKSWKEEICLAEKRRLC